MLWNIFSDTAKVKSLSGNATVLILIVMEYLLWQLIGKTMARIRDWVLILIVMEYLLWLRNSYYGWLPNQSLNPYCYGISSLTRIYLYNKNLKPSLNPYCYGISSLTMEKRNQHKVKFSLNPYCYGISSLT